MKLSDKKKRAEMIKKMINDGEILTPEFSHKIMGEQLSHPTVTQEISDQEFPEELWSEYETSDRMSSERYLEDPLGWLNLGPK